jgi:hypothetical protein
MLDLGFKPLNPAILPSANVELKLISAQVATLTNLEIGIILQNPAPEGSLVLITFPPEINLKDSSQFYLKSIYKSGKNKGYLNFTINTDQGIDTVSIPGAFLEYKDPGSKLILELT